MVDDHLENDLENEFEQEVPVETAETLPLPAQAEVSALPVGTGVVSGP